MKKRDEKCKAKSSCYEVMTLKSTLQYFNKNEHFFLLKIYCLQVYETSIKKLDTYSKCLIIIKILVHNFDCML